MNTLTDKEIAKLILDHVGACSANLRKDIAACARAVIAAHEARSGREECTGCEGKPATGNTPCAVCGRGEALDVKALAQRFLTWPVPASVYPDGMPGKPGRTGTNLLSAMEAEEMLQYVLADHIRRGEAGMQSGGRPATSDVRLPEGWKIDRIGDALYLTAPDGESCRFEDGRVGLYGFMYTFLAEVVAMSKDAALSGEQRDGGEDGK